MPLPGVMTSLPVLPENVIPWPASLPDEGAPCMTHDDCDPSTGLLCLDTLGDVDG